MTLVLTSVDGDKKVLVNTEQVKFFEPNPSDQTLTDVVFNQGLVRVVKESLDSIKNFVGGITVP